MTKTIYLAAGCFWGAEHYLGLINGIVNTEVGFANGNTEDPTYKQVYTDTTGYAEAVKVDYDPEVISLATIIDLYFKSIDPLSVNKQGEDEGTRYRTGIYYIEEADLEAIKPVYDKVENELGQKLAVELEPLKNFYPAEEYHQDYLDKNPTGYCHLPQALFEFAKKANR